MSVPVWVRSTRCGGGNCVEVAWVTSSACSGGSCVEVAHTEDRVLVRDSKLGEDSPVLSYTPAEWRDFLDGVRGGEFDV